MELREYKKKIVRLFLNNNILVTPEFVDQMNDITDIENVNDLVKNNISSEELFLISKEIGIKPDDKRSDSIENASKSTVKIVYSYDKPQKKKEVKDFVDYFNMRFKALEKILMQRQELTGLLPISRILEKKDRENVSIVGLVLEKKYTKNGNIILDVEDTSGIIKVLVSKTKDELFNEAKDIVNDEMIGVNGQNGDKIIFANSILLPDIPMNKELKKSPDEAYAVFLSDIHVGSKEFLEKELLRFISWIKGDLGSEQQKDISDKIRYVFIGGDLIAGVGIYPGQEDDLVIKDIYKQYEKCAEYLKMIPTHIPIIICPGNHDAMRIAEPQPPLYKDYAKAIWELPNVHMLSNPSIVNIHSSEDFSGFDVLLYHGYSFDYYIQEVESIRNNGGYDRADLMMKFLLRRRHLAPSHKSTLYIPNTDFDPLVISTLPDFFATGHIHKCAVSSYRNITMICGSCWEGKTAFQEKVGHHPEPCRVPVVNLQTRDVKIMKFGDGE